MNRSLLRLLCFVIAVLFFVKGANCQDFPMMHFTNDNGLPGNVVYQVYRDHKGFLWFGTDNGAARYNGVKFEVFTTFNGLPDNEVHSFCEDFYNRLWLVTANGELCYYKDDTFHTSKNTPLLNLPFPTYGIRTITRQSDGSVIMASNNSPKFLNVSESECHIIDLARFEKNNSLGQIIYRKKITPNRYKLTFTNAAVIVDTLIQVKQRFDVDTFRSEQGGSFQFFTSCQNQDYLFNRQHVLNTDLKHVATLPRDFHKNYYLNQVFFSMPHKFYATNTGLFIDDSIHLLRDYNISSVSTDRYGNYWVSTLSNGVFVLKGDFNKTNARRDVYDGQVLYATGYGGHLFFATTNNDLYHLYNNSISPLLDFSTVRDEKYRQNTTWLYLVDSSLRYFNIAGHNFVYRNNVLDSRTLVHSIDVGNDGKSMHYLNGYVYIQRPGSIIKYNNDFGVHNGTKYQIIGIGKRDERIMCMVKDNANNLWFSTKKGLYKIADTGIITAPRKLKNIPLKSFEFLGGDLIGYTNNNLMLVFKNIESNIQIDTITLDNCIWDKLFRIDATHMLVSTNSEYRLLTSTGVGQDRKYILSVVEDPFIPLQSDAVVSDGKVIYFLKGGAITSFAKECLYVKAPPPNLFFTELRSVSKTYAIGSRLVIRFGESKNILISFSAVSLTGGNVLCQYSISKSGKEYWTDIKGDEISLVNPGSGNYTVKIRAKNTNSDFSKPVEFALRIRKPFWVTWWFFTLSAILIIYATILVARQRLAYVLSRKDKEHEMKVRFMKSEYKALNALMNPHFIFNTLNNVQGLINKNDKLAANEYLRVIADLIRQNMHNISKELIPLQKEMELVANYLLLEKLRFKDKLNYQIFVDKGIDLSEILIPPLLIQPLVENSIKHGILRLESKSGAIYINIFERKGSLVIEVRDNGVGLNFKKSEKLSTHESFGLENIRKRIEQLSIIQSKEISFDIKERKNEKEGTQWTVATIIIPYGSHTEKLILR